MKTLSILSDLKQRLIKASAIPGRDFGSLESIKAQGRELISIGNEILKYLDKNVQNPDLKYFVDKKLSQVSAFVLEKNGKISALKGSGYFYPQVADTLIEILEMLEEGNQKPNLSKEVLEVKIKVTDEIIEKLKKSL